MRTILNEYNGSFTFELVAETVAETLFLVRMGMTKKKSAPWVSTRVDREAASTRISFGKNQKAYAHL